MNGLALRISKGGGKKGRNSLGYSPLAIPYVQNEALGEVNTHIKTFHEATSVDEQLTSLKKILDHNGQSFNEDIIRFLVVVFFYAETKHPVKCFLTRHITRQPSLQEPFSSMLASQITTSTKHKQTCKHYIDVVSMVATCISNFPAGALALKIIEMELAEYLKTCLECCVRTLRESKTLSPTEKNEIFNLAHLALRMFLYIVQKVSPEHCGNLALMFKDIWSFIQELMFDDDVPMDTKSVCGILYLTMHIVENGDDSWIDILQPQDDKLKHLLSNDASQLSVYSAIATVVPVDALQCRAVDGEPAVVVLTVNILAIGDRTSSESVFTLGVTRTLVQISKMLDRTATCVLGLRLVDKLLVFIWSHLEHYMDSVRHLTAQALSNVVRYCTALKKEGNERAMDQLFAALAALDRSRKSYYVSATALCGALGAGAVLARRPRLVRHALRALRLQPVQACATTTLETLLQKHVKEATTETIYKEWIVPILSVVAADNLEAGVLNVLENILAKAVMLDDNIIDYIVPHIQRSTGRDVKCVMVLLSAASRCGAARLPAGRGAELWRGLLPRAVLRAAALHACDETRMLSLSLVVESPKTTELFARGDFEFILIYLKYNINVQSPNFRQLTLSIMKKFMKRLNDSYQVLKRQNQPEQEYYVEFIEDLRAQCFDSLLPGANYSRRVVALQMLVWCEQLHLEGYERVWKHEYVEKLLMHLEDSYENNKSFALQILDKCPVELLKEEKYSISLKIEDILQQASSLKPTECISASYKLLLLKNKLPDYVLEGANRARPEPVTFALLRRLRAALRGSLALGRRSVAAAAARAPMYGLLHCARRLLAALHAPAISTDEQWAALVGDMVEMCVAVNAAVACVVNNSSPEGHLPMDMGGLAPHAHPGGPRFEDGRPVTAQMVLLCAWRSVKEVSLLLGEISSRISIKGEGHGGTLQPDQVAAIGAHFTQLLAETKHRGAFEQAYVGFTKLLARLWRCRSPALHELPRAWLAQLMAAITSGERQHTLCVTRRSAGLPFMIQALVTTEVQVQGNPKCFHNCMTTLLRLASTPTSPARDTETAIETRTHSINILRALFRNSELDECVGRYVGEGLLVAVRGFEGATWMERNAATLLFSALTVRVFGVARARDVHAPAAPAARSRMTGRVFFLRYPALYDFMLDKLKEVSNSGDSQVLRPALYPILLLLARLYPSSLEGTVSNLKLVAYVPHVLACAKSGVMKTRQLAAKAMVPLISPEQYILHLETMIALICDKKIKRNYCHGILLQLVRLVDARPDSLVVDEEARARLLANLAATSWVLAQALGPTPCYLLADEYVKVINLLIWRFPCLILEDMTNTTLANLHELLFNTDRPKLCSGRDVCLANAISLYLIILNKYQKEDTICQLICNSLNHQSYEVVLSVLNYLLTLYGEKTEGCQFQEHLSVISNKNVLKTLSENQRYVTLLCDILKNMSYQECLQKTLKVLTLERDTQRYIVAIKVNDTEITDEIIMNTLFECIRNEHENLTHIYLGSLLNFVSEKLKQFNISEGTVLEVIRVIFACSSSDNSENMRAVVVGFLENNLEELWKMTLETITEEEKFEFTSTLYAIIVSLLEDDEAALRQRMSDVIIACVRVQSTAVDVTDALVTSPEALRADVTDVRVTSPESLTADVTDARVTSPQALTADVTDARARVTSPKAGEALRADMRCPQLLVLALLDFKSEVCMTDDVSEECRVFDQNERYNIYLEESIWTVECADKLIQMSPADDALAFVVSIINDPVYRGTFDKLCGNNIVLFERILKNNLPSRNDVTNPKVKMFVDRLMKRH